MSQEQIPTNQNIDENENQLWSVKRRIITALAILCFFQMGDVLSVWKSQDLEKLFYLILRFFFQTLLLLALWNITYLTFYKKKK